MQFNFTAFNYQSADIEAEERNYLNHHVALARRFPGLQLYYAGKFLERGGQKPDHFRAALIAFDSMADAAHAMSGDVAQEIMADTQAHLTDVKSILFEGEVLVPFDSRKPGQRCLLMAAQFNLEKSAGIEAAERRYLDHHTQLAKQLPGLRQYIIGKFNPGMSDRYRIAVLGFDSTDALREAYRSPAGQELRKDEDATIRDAQVNFIDARVEL